MRPNHKYDKQDSILIDNDNLGVYIKLTLTPGITVLRFDEKS